MIGIFDSGLGGLSVLKPLLDRANNLDVVYFGDLKRSPYGERSAAELGALTAIGFDVLRQHGADKIVTACNSVSVNLMRSVLDIMDMPHDHIIEMVYPTARYCRDKRYKKVLLLATSATVASNVYEEELDRLEIGHHSVIISGLVDLIDTGAKYEDVVLHIKQFEKQMSEMDFDAVILGCTHFPLAIEAFKHVLGSHITFVDPGIPVSEVAVERFGSVGTGRLMFYLSKDSSVFRETVSAMFPNKSFEIAIT